MVELSLFTGRFIEHEDRSAIPQGAMLAAT
jgi:hypothetical protein